MKPFMNMTLSGTKTATVSVLKRGSSCNYNIKNIKSGKDYPKRGTADTAMDAEERFYISEYKDEEYIIYPKRAEIICSERTLTKDDFVNGKVKFNSNVSVDLITCYISLSESESKKKPEEIFTDSELYKLVNNIERVSEDKDHNTTTAFMEYDTRKATIFALVGTKFFLCNTGDTPSNNIIYNQGEYENLSKNDFGYANEDKFGKEVKVHLGNFGILYKIQLISKKENKIRIYPNTKGTMAILIKYNGKLHRLAIDSNADKKYWEIDMPKDYYFEFLLPGSTNGDIKFEIIQG